MAKSANIGLPYNIAEFANLMNKILGTGILSMSDDSYTDGDEMTLTVEDGKCNLRILFYTSSSEDNGRPAFERLKAIRRVIGGRWEKDYGYYMEFSKDYFGGSVELVTYRESACKKVVKAVEEIPARTIPAQVIPATTKEVVEWVCDE